MQDTIIYIIGGTITCLMTCYDAPIALGHTWLFQPLPVSTVPNTVSNLHNSSYRGLGEQWTVDWLID